MDLEKYLSRIGFDHFAIEPNLPNLNLLQRNHLLNVPFENLDIHWKRRIVVDIDKFYQKVVKNKRGGFCYELNGLFNELLKKIGYKTKIISARVFNGEGEFGKEYDHLAILAKIEDEEFLVDVGFGDFIAEPLNFALDIQQEDANRTYLIRRFDDRYFEVVKKVKDDRQSEYIFQNTQRDLSEFAKMCDFHQTSKSHFSKGKVCSLMMANGRKTLTDKRLKVYQNGNLFEIEVNSEKVFEDILEKEFNIKK